MKSVPDRKQHQQSVVALPLQQKTCLPLTHPLNMHTFPPTGQVVTLHVVPALFPCP